MSVKTALAAVAVLAAGGAVVAAGLSFPGQLTSTELAANTEVSSSQRTWACPDLVVSPELVEQVGAVVLPDAQPGSLAVLSGGSPVAEVTAANSGTTWLPSTGGSVAQVVAVEGFADSASTIRTYLDSTGEGRGMSIASCAEPAAEFWFPGVSSTPGRIDELLLFNPTPSPSVVNVALFGPEGEIAVAGADGVVVQPGGLERIRVDSLATSVSTATLAVTTTGGVVSAALRSTSIDGLIPTGAAYLPPADRPAETAQLAGVPAGSGSRLLIVTAPEDDVAVDVELLTDQGAVRPTQEARLPIAAGRTVTLELKDSLAGKSAGVSLTSSGPIVAAVQSFAEAAPDPTAPASVLNRVPVSDYGVTSVQPDIRTAATLPIGAIPGTATSLSLVAQKAGVTAQITVVSAGSGAGEPTTVEVAPDSAVTVPLATPDGAPATVVVQRTDGRGRLAAAVVQTGQLPDGPLISIWPTVARPDVLQVPLAFPNPQLVTQD